MVALRKESVDRNQHRVGEFQGVHFVALRKESVDRNLHSRNGHNVNRKVALRKESVDRNYRCRCARYSRYCVALRKESVDRNYLSMAQVCQVVSSLSARRAWIEIIDYIIDYVNDASRSPQGERG